jgi:hypothetical protein
VSDEVAQLRASEIARRRMEPGWRAAVLDDRASRRVFCLRASEDGSGLQGASLSERSEQCAEERAEALFLCLIARCRSLRIAPEAAYFVVARRREACRLAPPQHGGKRSGASDDDEARCASSSKIVCPA